MPIIRMPIILAPKKWFKILRCLLSPSHGLSKANAVNICVLHLNNNYCVKVLLFIANKVTNVMLSVPF